MKIRTKSKIEHMFLIVSGLPYYTSSVTTEGFLNYFITVLIVLGILEGCRIVVSKKYNINYVPTSNGFTDYLILFGGSLILTIYVINISVWDSILFIIPYIIVVILQLYFSSFFRNRKLNKEA